MFVVIMAAMCTSYFADFYSFKHAPLDLIDIGPNLTKTIHPRKTFTIDDPLFFVMGCSFILLELIYLFFMFYWCDTAMQFMRVKFRQLKNNSHPAIFVGLFGGYMMLFTFVLGVSTTILNARNNFRSWDFDLMIYRALVDSNNGTVSTKDLIHNCCGVLNAWSLIYFPLPTGSVEMGIILRKMLIPTAGFFFFFHNAWTSAVWTLVLAMLYSEYSTYLKQLSWAEINSGNALAEYLSLTDKLMCLSKEWNIRHVSPMNTQHPHSTLEPNCTQHIQSWQKQFGCGSTDRNSDDRRHPFVTLLHRSISRRN